MNIFNSKEYQDNLVKLEEFFSESKLMSKSIALVDDLPEQYSIELDMYKKPDSDSWAVLKIHIFDNEEKIMELHRNYPTAPFLFAKVKEKDYLFTSEDYQGLTIVNLTDRTKTTYIPEEWKEGFGWCTLEFKGFDEDELDLEVEGCYWGAPFETRLYSLGDLDNPNFENFKTFDEDDSEEEFDEEDDDPWEEDIWDEDADEEISLWDYENEFEEAALWEEDEE